MANIITQIKVPQIGTSDLRAGFMHYAYASGNGETYTATLRDSSGNQITIPQYTQGLTVVFSFDTVPTVEYPTVNINGLGAVQIRSGNYSSVLGKVRTSEWYPAGYVVLGRALNETFFALWDTPVKNIGQLADVTIGTLSDGDFLLYIGTDERWENVTPIAEPCEYTVFEDALTDYDGNSYRAVIIGSTVWMADNLKTQHFTNGVGIDSGNTASHIHPYATFPGEESGDISARVDEYGLLYNGAAAVSGSGETKDGNTPKLLPDGWVLPTLDQFASLGYAFGCGHQLDQQDRKVTDLEMYANFGVEYAGYVEAAWSPQRGNDSGSGDDGGEKASQQRGLDFGSRLYMWSSTEANYDSKSPTQLFYCCFGEDSPKLSIIKPDAYGGVMSGDSADFRSVRGVYDGTVGEFLAEYYRTHPMPSPDGKFLKNLGDNQLAWTPIRWEDICNVPFGEECSDKTYSIQLEAEVIEGAQKSASSNPSNGVLHSSYEYYYFNGSPLTVEVFGNEYDVSSMLPGDGYDFGSYWYLMDIYDHGSSSDGNNNQTFGLYIAIDNDSTGQYATFDLFQLVTEHGSSAPTVSLTAYACETITIDPSYVDADPKRLVVRVSKGPNWSESNTEDVTSTHTAEEIYEAWNAGRDIVMCYGDNQRYLHKTAFMSQTGTLLFYDDDFYKMMYEISDSSLLYEAVTVGVSFDDMIIVIETKSQEATMPVIGTSDAGKVLAVKSTKDGYEWVSQSGSKFLVTVEKASGWDNDTNSANVTCNHTAAEIWDAYNSGKDIVMQYNPSAQVVPFVVNMNNQLMFMGNDYTSYMAGVFGMSYKYETIFIGVSLGTVAMYNYSNQATMPTMANNAGKVLAVNSTMTAYEWVNQSGGSASNDFTHTANATVSGQSVTVTFAANTRGSRMISVSQDIGVSFDVNNYSDNYLWVKNIGTQEIDITISTVKHNNSPVGTVYMPSDGITAQAGAVCEIGVIANADGAFITSRSDLEI